MILTLVATLVAAIAFFMVGWMISMKLGKAVIVDVFWGLGGGLLALTAFLTGDGSFTRKSLLLTLVGLWGLRLSIYLFFRVLGAGEDKRYVDLMRGSGKPFWLFTLVNVFMLQAVIIWLNLLPVSLAVTADQPAQLTWLDYTGLFIWITGFFFQALGDYQLQRFKADPNNKGAVLSSGLWRYTRHPNYFGEVTMWWGIYIIAAATDPGRWMILSPIMMTLILLKVSGVAMTDRYMQEKGEAFKEYQRKTSAFFPLPPKN